MTHHKRPIEARGSEIEGKGIFALEDFAPGDFIYRVQVLREVTEDTPLRPDLDERPEHCAYPNGKILLYDTPDRYMNHSCDPNCYYAYDDQAHPYVVARRTLKAGDELRVDYLINNPGGDSWPCTCGAERCRGETGHSFLTLPEVFQREYLPLLADWYRRKFASELSDLERQLADS